MGDQLANNPDALRLFFTEEIYLVPEPVMEDVQVQRPSVQSGVVGRQSFAAADVTVAAQEIAEDASTTNQASDLKTPEEAIVIHTDSSGSPQIVLDEAASGDDVSIVREPALAVRPDFVFLGKNKRSILILVNDEENEVSTEEGRELLKNIVKAINLTGADFALLNYSAYQGTRFEQLQQFFSSKVLFAFGVRATQLGLQYEDQNTLLMHEGIKMIFSANLHQLSSDMQGKKALWSCLKQMDI